MRPRVFALTLALSTLTASTAFAQTATRDGGRFGLALHAGFASTERRADSTDLDPAVGIHMRFGGAFSDRVHLLGELSIYGAFGDRKHLLSSLDLELQGFITRQLHVRGGFGATEQYLFDGGTFALGLPGPHFIGGVGYDVYQQGERAVTIELLGQGGFPFREPRDGSGIAWAVTLGAGVDWF